MQFTCKLCDEQDDVAETNFPLHSSTLYTQTPHTHIYTTYILYAHTHTHTHTHVQLSMSVSYQSKHDAWNKRGCKTVPGDGHKSGRQLRQLWWLCRGGTAILCWCRDAHWRCKFLTVSDIVDSHCEIISNITDLQWDHWASVTSLILSDMFDPQWNLQWDHWSSEIIDSWWHQVTPLILSEIIDSWWH